MKDLDAILQNLLCSNMPELISNKIDEALDSFDIDAVIVFSHREFNDCICRFIRQIYGNGLIFPKALDSRTALMEAISLLEQHYESQGAAGYDAAYLDTVDESGKGIHFVLRELAELVKSIEISRWLESCYVFIIDPIDKDQHLEIIIDLLRKHPIHIPDSIRMGNPASFIRYYRDLIELVVSIERFSMQLAGPVKNLEPN